MQNSLHHNRCNRWTLLCCSLRQLDTTGIQILNYPLMKTCLLSIICKHCHFQSGCQPRRGKNNSWTPELSTYFLRISSIRSLRRGQRYRLRIAYKQCHLLLMLDRRYTHRKRGSSPQLIFCLGRSCYSPRSRRDNFLVDSFLNRTQEIQRRTVFRWRMVDMRLDYLLLLRPGRSPQDTECMLLRPYFQRMAVQRTYQPYSSCRMFPGGGCSKWIDCRRSYFAYFR